MFAYLKSVRARIAALSLIVMTSIVAACVFAPGKFTSNLEIRKDRTFSFAYSGELIMVPLRQTEDSDGAVFEPQSCYDEETAEERDCSNEEIADQKVQWEAARAQKKASDAQATQMLLGGIDPNDPESGKAIATKLARQAGWKKVEYLGNGKFDVDFAINGKLDRDFVFPTFEGFPMSNAFVQVIVRNDKTVRIDAPGYGPSNSGASMASMISDAAPKGGGSDSATELADGIFTVVTDAEILANNTDEGPSAASGGQQLRWTVNPGSRAAPTALLKLAQ